MYKMKIRAKSPHFLMTLGGHFDPQWAESKKNRGPFNILSLNQRQIAFLAPLVGEAILTVLKQKITKMKKKTHHKYLGTP